MKKVLFSLLSTAICFSLFGCAKTEPVQKENIPQLESNLIAEPSDISLAEKLAEAQRQVDDSELGVKVSTALVAKGTHAEMLIENPARNKKSFAVVIEVTDYGIIYESGLIPPGTHIKEFELTQELPKGEYTGVLTFDSYLNNEPAGSTALEISIASK